VKEGVLYGRIIQSCTETAYLSIVSLLLTFLRTSSTIVLEVVESMRRAPWGVCPWAMGCLSANSVIMPFVAYKLFRFSMRSFTHVPRSRFVVYLLFPEVSNARQVAKVTSLQLLILVAPLPRVVLSLTLILAHINVFLGMYPLAGNCAELCQRPILRNALPSVNRL
jgi:hypothetical protein